MEDRELLNQIREIVNGLSVRGQEHEKALAINQIKILLTDPNDRNIRPCPLCGHPIDIGPRERGTHMAHGYRQPCIEPPLEGSINFERKEEEVYDCIDHVHDRHGERA